jgi:hypothetical protein
LAIAYCLIPPVIGALAQLGEHLLCKQGVIGSIPISSTISAVFKAACGVELADCLPCLIEKIKFASVRLSLMPVLIIIVKRRYVWKLPGVLRNS